MSSSTEQAATSARKKVLVLGEDTKSFLTVIRSLGRIGVEVHVAWCPRDAVAVRSRYVFRYHDVPAPAGGAPWQEPFADLLGRERFDLVLPTNDPTLIPLQEHRDRFEPLARIYLLDDRAYRVTFDKLLTHELALEVGVPVADTRVVRGPEDVEGAVSAFDYPVVVKPRASFSATDLDHRYFVQRATTPQQARAAIDQLLPSGAALVQENVNGGICGVEVLAADGELLMTFQHERVHEPVQGGASSYRRSVPVEPDLEDAARKLLGELRYTGVAMVEFKRDRTTGRWVLIEINGRFWGSLPLAVAAGADFPAALWRLLVEGDRNPSRAYRTGVYARNLRSDTAWFWRNLRANRSDPTLATRPLLSVAAEVANVVRGREHLDTFTRDDPRPGLAELAQIPTALGDVARRRVAALGPVRSLRRERARAALAGASEVAFVCYGNICRSPFAAAVTRQRLPYLRVTSAGTDAVAGRPSTVTARAVARELGVDLDGHQATPLDDEAVRRADAIFVFDERNARTVRRRFPAARGKVHLLGSLAAGSPARLADPYGHDASTFRWVYRSIIELLEPAPARDAGEQPGRGDAGAERERPD